MNKSLSRSLGFWLLIVLSLASAGAGGWLISGQVSTMTTTLLDGTATGVEVYVGQSVIVFASALVGAGVLGLLIAVALLAVQSLLPRTAPVALEPIDWTATPGEPAADAADDAAVSEAQTAEAAAEDAPADAASVDDVDAPQPEHAESDDRSPVSEDDGQNGSSGSTATATKISVK